MFLSFYIRNRPYLFRERGIHPDALQGGNIVLSFYQIMRLLSNVFTKNAACLDGIDGL